MSTPFFLWEMLYINLYFVQCLRNKDYLCKGGCSTRQILRQTSICTTINENNNAREKIGGYMYEYQVPGILYDQYAL